MDTKGNIASIPTALIGLLTASLVLYIVMLVWQPIVVDSLFPLLNNAQAFRYGAAAITIMQVTVLVAAASILIVFFQEIKGGGGSQPPVQGYYG